MPRGPLSRDSRYRKRSQVARRRGATLCVWLLTATTPSVSATSPFAFAAKRWLLQPQTQGLRIFELCMANGSVSDETKHVKAQCDTIGD